MPQARCSFPWLSLSVPALALSMASCASTPHVVKPATDAQRAALIDQVKALEGTWTMTGEDGKAQTAAVFAVTSSGSVVREVMFPGQPHEMTNLYHMDGDSLLLTHYCAAGNQPTMRAHAGPNAHVLTFELDSVSNMTRSNELYMGGLTLTLKDANTLEAHWTSFIEGKVEGTTDFTMTRAH